MQRKDLLQQRYIHATYFIKAEQRELPKDTILCCITARSHRRKNKGEAPFCGKAE